MSEPEGQSAAREDEGAVKQSNLAGTPDSAKAQGQSARKKEKPKMVVAFIDRPDDIPREYWDGETYQLYRCGNWMHIEGVPSNPSQAHGLVLESDLTD